LTHDGTKIIRFKIAYEEERKKNEIYKERKFVVSGRNAIMQSATHSFFNQNKIPRYSK